MVVPLDFVYKLSNRGIVLINSNGNEKPNGKDNNYYNGEDIITSILSPMDNKWYNTYMKLTYINSNLCEFEPIVKLLVAWKNYF